MPELLVADLNEDMLVERFHKMALKAKQILDAGNGKR